MSNDNPISFSLNAPPIEAMTYLASKGYALSFDYDELMHQAHHHSFTVAKMMQLDLLADVHQSLLTAQAKGTPYQQWAKDLIPTLQAKGWWGEKEIYDERTGEYKTIKIDGNRLKTIYHTNLSTAYAVARYKELMELPDDIGFWRYHAIKDARVRPTHAMRHGTILPRNHPWWKTNYPPNGWRCRCKVMAYSQDDLDNEGWKVTDPAPPRLADVDWGYDIGAGMARIDQVYFNKVQSLVCLEENNKKRNVPCAMVTAAQQAMLNNFKAEAALDYAFYNGTMPKPRDATLPLSTAVSETAFMTAFMAQFDNNTLFTTMTLDQLAIGVELFLTHTNQWKWDKRERAQWLNYMALNIKEPDEIWRYEKDGKEYLVLISRFSGNHNLQVIAKFEREIGKTAIFTGVTTFASEDRDYLVRERRKIERDDGELVYRIAR